MSKLDEAFLKAYAKDRVAVTRIQPTVILSELDEETRSEIWIDSDDQSVLRHDGGVVDAASFLGQSDSGRTRGSAASDPSSDHSAEIFTTETATRSFEAADSIPMPPRDPHSPLDPPASFAEPVALGFDPAAHSLRGPHFQPISLNLAAFDLFAPAPKPKSAPVSAPLPDAGSAADASSRSAAAFTRSDILLTEAMDRIEPDMAAADEPEASPPPEACAPPADSAAPAATPFQAVWEVDRFEFEEIICELGEPTSPLREAGRQLQVACGEGLKILAVTSPLREQGRSTLAVTLSRMVAATGLSVVLVDGDLDRPSLADKLSMEVRLGWDEAIRSGLPIEEVAVHSVEDRFTVLPLVAPHRTDPTRPAAAATAAMLGQLREAFDLVIIDTGNINVVGGWIPGADRPCMIDAALVIEDARGDDPNAQQACLCRLQKLGIENIGIVENFAD